MKETINLSKSDLTDEQKEQLLDVLAEHREAFSLDGELGNCQLLDHEISLKPGTRPIYQRPYRYSMFSNNEARKHVSGLLEKGVIEPSTSPWSSPICIVTKPRSDPNAPVETRMTIDYRKLNDQTLPDVHPLPRLDDMIDRIGNENPLYFSTIDLLSGFFQVNLDPKSRPKTAFSFEGGHYQFTKLAQGLKNSPASFSRLMQLILSGIQYFICLCYIDDIIIFSRTFEDHLKHIGMVLQRLVKANVKAKPQKCQFGCQEIRFLGNILSKDGVKPDPAKTAIIKDMPPPKTVKQLRRCLGLMGFYRRFVPNFQVHARHLYKLLQNDVKWEWSDKCQAGFESLRDALVNAPVLGYPDFEKPFLVYTDASYDGFGAMLVQEQECNGETIKRAIWYAGRSLNKHEKNYSATDLEIAAVYYAVLQFRPYLQHNRVIFHTDHQALTSLLDCKQPTGNIIHLNEKSLSARKPFVLNWQLLCVKMYCSYVDFTSGPPLL